MADDVIDTFQCFYHVPVFKAASSKRRPFSNEISHCFKLMYVLYFGFRNKLHPNLKVPKSL